MNKSQARRLAKAIQGYSMVLGETPLFVTDKLNEQDTDRFCDAWKDMGLELLRRAGFDGVPEPQEIMAVVLGSSGK